MIATADGRRQRAQNIRQHTAATNMGSLRVSAPLREFLIFAQRRGDAERDEESKNSCWHIGLLTAAIQHNLSQKSLLGKQAGTNLYYRRRRLYPSCP
jgi:hypothetical protein